MAETIKEEFIPSQIGFRVSEAQKQRIEQNANKFGLPVSTFLLRASLNKLEMFEAVSKQFAILTETEYKFKECDILSVEKYGGSRNCRLHFAVNKVQYNEIVKYQKMHGFDDVSKYVVAIATKPYALAYEDIIRTLDKLEKRKKK